MASASSSVLPNPNTPLAFLPPDIANQLEVSRYIYIASLGAFVWDTLSNIPSDYKLLFKLRGGPPTFTYFVSRVATLAYIITSTVFQVGAVGNCQALQVALGICYVFAVSSTSLLFFFRVRAIFNGEKIVVYIFGFLWLAVLAACITVPFAISGGHIGPTTHCINTEVKPFSSTALIVSAVNDTLVLISISMRLLYNASIEDNISARAKAFWGGGTLPRFSKSILQSGQQYYLLTVGGNILTMVMILTPSVPPVYRAMFTIPSIAIENSMACKVFRDIKFGIIEPSGMTSFKRSTRNGLSNSSFQTKAPQRTNQKKIDSIDITTCDTSVLDAIPDKASGGQLPLELSLMGVSTSRASSSYERSTDAKFAKVGLAQDV